MSLLWISEGGRTLRQLGEVWAEHRKLRILLLALLLHAMLVKRTPIVRQVGLGKLHGQFRTQELVSNGYVAFGLLLVWAEGLVGLFRMLFVANPVLLGFPPSMCFISEFFILSVDYVSCILFWLFDTLFFSASVLIVLMVDL